MLHNFASVLEDVNQEVDQFNFSNNKNVQVGDRVILFGNANEVSCVLVEKAKITNTRIGNFNHQDIINLPWGDRVRDRKTNKWVAVLRPTPELHTLSVSKRTQILYHADIATVISMLKCVPGMTLVESGTGSGSLTNSLSRSVAPTGMVHTFEFHKERYLEAAREISGTKYGSCVTLYHRDVCEEGFGAHLIHAVDGVFLDLPQPWVAVEHADEVLKEGGHMVTFSPCVEQVQRTHVALTRLSYMDIRVVECLSRPWGIDRGDRPSSRTGRSTGKEPEPPNTKRTVCGKSSADVKQEGASDGDTDKEVEAKRRRTLSSSISAGSPLTQSGETHLHLSYPLPMRGHTGYLLVATKPLSDDVNQLV
eukprot:GHVN01068932.1.p1 GENE.GHVN01068932.1~~GHVN01068932.1.p1  ORF type:complete len:364 (+),score=38.69 GHVN01068932.1:223-1314(+)